MKTRFFIFGLLIFIAVQLAAQIVEIENWISCNDPYPEEPYSIPTLKLNTNDARIESILPILDTLTTNKQLDLYDWLVISEDDITCFAFGNDDFELLKRPMFLNRCKGLYKHQYKDDSKYFAIFTKTQKASDKSDAFSSCFVEDADSTTIVFKNKRLPKDVYYITPEIATFVKCMFYGDSMDIESFKVNYKL